MNLPLGDFRLEDDETSLLRGYAGPLQSASRDWKTKAAQYSYVQQGMPIGYTKLRKQNFKAPPARAKTRLPLSETDEDKAID